MIWLLMLALPFQGYAAASMFACTTGNAAVATDSMTPMSAAPDQAVHADHHASHDSVSQSAADTPSASATSPDVDHGCTLCSLCSACHGMAIVDTSLLHLEPHLPQADLIEPHATPLAAHGHRLEKPPRA